MHKIFIYLYIIHLLKSFTCFEHYPAHLQEVYVVIVYMQPLVSSLSAGDCPVHRLTGAQDRTGQDRTGQDRTGQDRTGQNRTGQDRTGQDRTGQDRTGQVLFTCKIFFWYC
jgi:hypothetical protein